VKRIDRKEQDKSTKQMAFSGKLIGDYEASN
jgi:hypothetical protein